ncbi:hypothetical protein CNECB9_3120004 [Cupriavidus necator]|uniref:Uncharacterized protein n=1 Tax=Cupriavidus necator TaxID=106590 RepID=A0A1K0IGB3_CUPNE|nr:hypothetical protein CNECB9_3120004 [Cupriavidus necator]
MKIKRPGAVPRRVCALVRSQRWVTMTDSARYLLASSLSYRRNTQGSTKSIAHRGKTNLRSGRKSRTRQYRRCWTTDSR